MRGNDCYIKLLKSLVLLQMLIIFLRCEDFLLLLLLIVVHHSSGLSETLSESVSDGKVCLLFILRTLLHMGCRALHDWT